MWFLAPEAVVVTIEMIYEPEGSRNATDRSYWGVLGPPTSEAERQ